MSEHTAHPGVETGSHDEHHPHVNYWYIFYALCVLTGLSVLADLARENSTVAGIFGPDWIKVIVCAVVLSIATAKALFVMLYFMHLKFEGKWKFVLLAPTIVLAMAIPAALMPDIGSHYYDYEVPQLEDDGSDAEAAGTGSHGAAPHATGAHGAATPAAGALAPPHGAADKKN